MNVTSGNRNRAVSSDPCERPGVAAGLTQPSQECVPQAVQNEGPHLTGSDCLDVLLLMLDGSRWPLRVGAGHTQPSTGLPTRSQRISRILLTLTITVFLEHIAHDAIPPLIERLSQILER